MSHTVTSWFSSCRFDFYPYTVSLNYQNTLLMVQEEVAIVLLGPFGNIFTFILLIFSSWVIQKLLGAIPDIGSKFILAVGIQAFLDPFLILTVDCILKVRHVSLTVVMATASPLTISGIHLLGIISNVILLTEGEVCFTTPFCLALFPQN